MRQVVGLAVLVLLAACGEAPREEMVDARDEASMADVSTDSYEPTMSRAAPVARRAPPGVNPTAAPGVAWSYESTFRLADQRISSVQEQHAAACEKLGVAKCRIVGLDYTVDENEVVQGRLDVKLEPAIARQFGKDAFAAVDRANGRLISTEFNGEDVGSRIASNTQQLAQAEEELKSVQKQLADDRKSPQEIASSPIQGDPVLREEQLQQTIRDIREQTAGAMEQLANTPMTLHYYGEGSVPGFDENPFRAAWTLFMTSLVLLVSFVLKALAILVPWGALLAILVALWRLPPVQRARRWIMNRTRPQVATPE